jgi:hypothetical protein
MKTSQPILKLPDFEGTFYAQTDASDRGLGAVLLQWENDVRLPVVFASRKLSNGERNYLATHDTNNSKICIHD